MTGYHCGSMVLAFALLAGCARQVPEPLWPGRPMGLDTVARSTAIASSLDDVETVAAGHLSDLGSQGIPEPLDLRGEPLPRWLPDVNPLLDLLHPVTFSTPNHDRGGALADFMATLPSDEVAYYGTSRLTAEQLLGNAPGEGLCEDPDLLVSFEEDGNDWEASLPLPRFMHFVGDIEVLHATLSSGCETALADNSGDVAAAVAAGTCTLEEQHEFFEDGSACLACVATAGDYAGCVDTGDCPEETVAKGWAQGQDGQVQFYDWLRAPIFACAPDWTTYVYLYADLQEDGSLPAYWDSEHWAWLFIPFWREDLGRVWYYGFEGSEGAQRGDTLANGATGYAGYVRRRGDTATPYRLRGWYASSVRVGGSDIYQWWAYNPGPGAIVIPQNYQDTDGNGTIGPGDDGWGYALGYSWGLHPYETRPDGESEARDFLATHILKQATNISGVFVTAANHSRCSNWVPRDDGTFRCTDLATPDPGWLNDAEVSWLDAEHSTVYLYPKMTIASTGLPDPDVPGGWIIHVAGTAGLADPDWEGCAYPHVLEADLGVFQDIPTDFGVPGAITGQVYDFGKDDAGIRVTMNTNRARNYCPDGP